jgi:hypothetical protein
LDYAAQCKGWKLSRQSSKVQYIPDVDYSGMQSKKETSKKKRKHEDSRPTSASVLEEDDDDKDILVDTPQHLNSQQQPPSSPMQFTDTMSASTNAVVRFPPTVASALEEDDIYDIDYSGKKQSKKQSRRNCCPPHPKRRQWQSRETRRSRRSCGR